MMVPVCGLQRFQRHAQITRRLKLVGASLHEPRRGSVAESVSDHIVISVRKYGPHELCKRLLGVCGAALVFADVSRS